MSKLTDLNPRFVGAGGEGITNSETGEQVPERHGIAISFDCPCGGKCGQRAVLQFENPLDGRPYESPHPKWKRIGKTFEDMTLTPSIQRRSGCNWHGYLTDGHFKEC